LSKTTPQEVASSPATSSVASVSSLECEDFVDQADAQTSFDSGNSFNLEDNDGDGIACEETSKFSKDAKTPGEIKGEVAEHTNPQDKAAQYIVVLVEELEKFPPHQQEYGMSTVQTWGKDSTYTQAAYKLDCKDWQEGSASWIDYPEQTAQEAYVANEYSHPYEQYDAWYKARGQALQRVGC